MTTDNQKKYEEAAREWADNEGQALYDKGRLPRELVHESWISGASFAEKEFERWRKDYDATMLNNLAAVKEEAHNSAIDKAIDLAYNSGLGDFAVEIGKLKL